MDIKTLNTFIATNTLLAKLKDEGFELGHDQMDHPTITQDAGEPMRVWAEIGIDETTYFCLMNVEDLHDSYPEELQDILNGVQSFTAADDAGTTVVLESTQYVEIVAAVKQYIHL